MSNLNEYFKEFTDLYLPPNYQRKLSNLDINLPNLTLSYDIPPVFPKISEKNDNFNFERYLGLYCPERDEIVIYLKGIYDCAYRTEINYKYLATIVLLHELGHWTFYKVLKDETIDGFLNPVSDYDKNRVIHETFAQTYTALVIQENDLLFSAFKALNDLQNSDYKQWVEPFKKLVNNNVSINIPPVLSDKESYMDIFRNIEQLDYLFASGGRGGFNLISIII